MPQVKTDENPLDKPLRQVRLICKNAAAAAAEKSAQWVNGASVTQILRVYENLLDTRQTLTDLKDNNPGIIQYARDYHADQGYDFAAEVGGFITEVDATVTLIRGAVPTDANGYIREREFAAGFANYVENTFTGAQLAPLRAQLDTLAASIDAG